MSIQILNTNGQKRYHLHWTTIKVCAEETFYLSLPRDQIKTENFLDISVSFFLIHYFSERCGPLRVSHLQFAVKAQASWLPNLLPSFYPSLFLASNNFPYFLESMVNHLQDIYYIFFQYILVLLVGVFKFSVIKICSKQDF